MRHWLLFTLILALISTGIVLWGPAAWAATFN
jgi:hypothetical protein